MPPIRIFAATGNLLARVDSSDGERFTTALHPEGSGVQCVYVDPHDPNRVYAGTFDDGIYRSLDASET